VRKKGDDTDHDVGDRVNFYRGLTLTYESSRRTKKKGLKLITSNLLMIRKEKK